MLHSGNLIIAGGEDQNDSARSEAAWHDAGTVTSDLAYDFWKDYAEAVAPSTF